MNSPWLKAGLIGSGVMLLLNLLGFIPNQLCGCLTFLLELLAFVGAGALAGYFMAPPRESGKAAVQGALAGLLMGILGALIATLLAPLALTFSGGSAAMINALPPDTVTQLEQAGIDPATLFGGGTVAGVTAICCFPAGAIFGAGLGALGGLIYAAANPGKLVPMIVDDWTQRQLPPEA